MKDHSVNKELNFRYWQFLPYRHPSKAVNPIGDNKRQEFNRAAARERVSDHRA
jgi:hypothetical protein